MVRTSKLKQVKTKLGIDDRLTRVNPKRRSLIKSRIIYHNMSTITIWLMLCLCPLINSGINMH